MLWITTTAGANPFLGSGEKTPQIRPPSQQASDDLIDLQLRFREKIADALDGTLQEGSLVSLLALLGFSLAYGFIHAAGPGHRKTVIFSLFLTRKTRPWEPLTAGMLAAILHGGSAVALILLFRFFTNGFFSGRVSATSTVMEGVTFVVLSLIAAGFFTYAIISLTRKENSTAQKDSGGIYATIAATGFFPCPGAVMVLVLANTLDRFALGVLAVTAMSLGMGLTVSLAGYAAYTGRAGLFYAVKQREKVIRWISHLLEAGAYLFLLLFSLWMAWPFLRSIW